MTIDRTAIIAAVAAVLDEHADACDPVHRELGARIADRLGLATVSESETVDPAAPPYVAPPAPNDALNLGVWIDDPPRIVLAGRYLDRLCELPISHVAVMLDGPKPGLGDQKWDWRDLERLFIRLPTLDRVLTAWIPADADAVAELARELPGLLRALGTSTLELDAEGAGHWRERDVRGYEDADGDGKRLDDAARGIADALWAIDGLETIEVTSYPGMLARAALLVRELSALGPTRYVSQDYAVATRDGVPQAWDGRHGPLRMATESRAKAASALPPEVELCSGAAAYRTTWPDGRDSMVPAIRASYRARLVRLWSSKWLCRKAGHERRRGLLEELRPLTRRA